MLYVLRKKYVNILILFFCFLLGNSLSVQSKNVNDGIDSLEWSVNLIGRILGSCREWYFTDSTFRNPVKGVYDYAVNSPLDTIVVRMEELLSGPGLSFFDRSPDYVRNLNKIPGYVTPGELDTQIENLNIRLRDSLLMSEIIVPGELLERARSFAKIVPPFDPNDLFSVIDKKVPDELIYNIEQSFERLRLPEIAGQQYVDSIKTVIADSCRIEYNNSILVSWRDSVANEYRGSFISSYIDSAGKSYRRNVEAANNKLLNIYNDSVVRLTNDSVRLALEYLTHHAKTDSVFVEISNLSGEKFGMFTADRPMTSARIFLKNEQNDSLGVVLYNMGKRGIMAVVDDAVMFDRFKETQYKGIRLQEDLVDMNIEKVKIEKPKLAFWKRKGEVSVGLTQSAFSNWAKGGENSLAMLGIGKYSAIYVSPKAKWENIFELRYGGYYSESTNYVKNADKLELQSRYGYSAFKKWYYSADFNFLTQVAKGYKGSGDERKVISNFMSPGYITLSLGMDYNPNDDFSVFISPLTARATFVTDSSKVIKESYGVNPAFSSLWEPGIVVRGKLKKELRENITYETRMDFFSNFSDIFEMITYGWEQILTMRITQYITTQIHVNLLFDHNTTFEIKDAEGNPTGEVETRWQFKELFTIGFKYRFL